MEIEELGHIIQEREIYIDNPAFYSLAFSFASEQRKRAYALDGDNFRRVLAEEYNTLSQKLDITKFQESCQVRNVLRTRRLANLLISDKGELNRAVIPRLIDLVREHLHSLGPDRQYDSSRQEQILRVLNLLNESKECLRLLNCADKPIGHRYAEQIIRDTLLLPANTVITTAHARRAVLAAWMCTLRQNVGSCFGTAPSIIIHDEQPEKFLKDVNELLNTGRLIRTFGGVEYTVPLSCSWGGGDLKKPFVLPMGEDFEKSRIWLSPGLGAAFEASGLINSEESHEVKEQKAKGLITDVLSKKEWNQPFMVTSAEEIISWVLLKHLDLTAQDVEEYQNRPQEMVIGGMLAQGIVPVKAGGGKGGRCGDYLIRFANGCNALKALADNALLKAWEFSIASLAETKSQFTRWNLYSSLGLGPKDAGGIGECMYVEIGRQLDAANRRVEELQHEYEGLFLQIKSMESRMRAASSETEAQWLKAQYQTHRNEFYTFEEMRDKAHRKAENLSKLYDVLISYYDDLFPRYFQEVYDPDMHEITQGPYDDSPAGFRLLYKHGRANTSQWTYIRTPNEFVEALANFFNTTEREITTADEMVSLEPEVSEITTAIVSHIRTKEFLETAFYRMAVAHNTKPIKDPLDHLDQIEKKPWAYTSGGTMGTLVSCYYKLETPPTETGRWVENPTELFVFLTDIMKKMLPKMQAEFVNGKNGSLLIHSPTHAFILKPGKVLFKKAWTTDAYTYTWIRDNLIEPRKRVLENIDMDEEQLHYLLRQLAEKVQINFRHYFQRAFGSLFGSMSPKEFRNHVIQTISKDRAMKAGGNSVLSEGEVDSMLYSYLPLFRKGELEERLEKLFATIPSIAPDLRKKLMSIYELVSGRYFQEIVINADQLQTIAKGVLCLALESTTAPIDVHMAVATAAQSLGYALPGPILVADSNWVKEEFFFAVNPGSCNLEFWRGDATGRVGVPMSSWDQWLDGSRRDRTWGVYDKPYEYR